MYNFYLIANGPNANEPAFEKIILSEDDAKVAGYEDFQKYIDDSLSALAEACIKEDATYIILNQEEFMRLVLKISQKI
jgi:hypothetical protein